MTKQNSNAEQANQTREQLNTDTRKPYDWKSRWCGESSKKIREESIIIGIVLFLSVALTILVWRGTAFDIIGYKCSGCLRRSFDSFAYLFLGGLLGGTLYGLKYLYKVVARGYWHMDRRLWRIFSPWLSACVALAFGLLFDSGIIGLSFSVDTASGYFSIGFLTGYFADRAIAKMSEVAETLFGPSESKK